MRNIEYLFPKETTDKYESDIQTGILLEESDLLKIGIAYITISEYRSAEKFSTKYSSGIPIMPMPVSKKVSCFFHSLMNPVSQWF